MLFRLTSSGVDMRIVFFWIIYEAIATGNTLVGALIVASHKVLTVDKISFGWPQTVIFPLATWRYLL